MVSETRARVPLAKLPCPVEAARQTSFRVVPPPGNHARRPRNVHTTLPRTGQSSSAWAEKRSEGAIEKVKLQIVLPRAVNYPRVLYPIWRVVVSRAPELGIVE